MSTHNAPRSVCPEYYVLTHKLKTESHLLEAQAQGAIAVVANILFNKQEHGKWKVYQKGNISILIHFQHPQI